MRKVNIGICLLTILSLFAIGLIYAVEPLKPVTINADQIERNLKESGKAVIYGIYFDDHKAVIKPESEQTLNEIAEALKDEPTMKVFVVCHTDNTGNINSNISLSKLRAQAVVRALISKYGITSDRLLSHGVGPLAPIDTNLSEEGRTRNCRLELVKRQMD